MRYEILPTNLVHLDYVIPVFSGGIVSVMAIFQLYNEDKRHNNGIGSLVGCLVDERRGLIID